MALLQRFLEKEGAEVIMPGLMDFLCYCMFNACEDRGLFGSNAYLYPIYKMLYKFMCRSKDEISKSPISQACYNCSSALNYKHQLFAYCSLFSVAFCDVYVRLCAMGIWTDWRIL